MNIKVINKVELSVIVTVYNAENYLKECLNSILKQTIQNIEIVCVNDGSTDNSKNIIEEYILQNNKIKLINHEKNMGPAAAKQTGILHAAGKYIAFVDSDDYLINDKIFEIGVNKLNTKNIDIFSFSMHGGGIAATLKEFIRKPKILKINGSNIILKSETIMWNKIYKAEQIKQIKLDNDIKYDDITFWFKFCIKFLPKIYNSRIPAYYSRVNINSVTHNENNNIHMVYAVKKLLEIAEENQHINIIQPICDILNGVNHIIYNRIKNINLKNEYKKGIQEIVHHRLLGINSIDSLLSINIYIFFLSDDKLEEKFINDSKKQVLVWKIKREIKRLIMEIKV